MSKSAENDASRINLADDADAIASKVKRCKTDATDGLEFGNPDRPEATNLLTLYQLATGKTKARLLAGGGMEGTCSQPGAGQHWRLGSTRSGAADRSRATIERLCRAPTASRAAATPPPFPQPRAQDEVVAECGAMRWGAFKPLLADALVAHLAPIQARYLEATSDPAYLDGVLARGAEAAAEVADRTLADVRDAMGFVAPLRRR
jgi:hypothetical protein